MTTIKILNGNDDTLMIATETAELYGYNFVVDIGEEFVINDVEKANDLCDAICECGVNAITFKNNNDFRAKLIKMSLDNIIDVESERIRLEKCSNEEPIRMIRECERDMYE